MSTDKNNLHGDVGGSTDRLAPCPFCGSSDIDSAFATHSDNFLAAGCMNCGGTGPMRSTRYGASLAWNSRTPYGDMLHPCGCDAYNGGQCYNCLNGAHDICSGSQKCKKPRDSVIGLPIVVQNSKSIRTTTKHRRKT